MTKHLKVIYSILLNIAISTLTAFIAFLFFIYSYGNKINEIHQETKIIKEIVIQIRNKKVND